MVKPLSREEKLRFLRSLEEDLEFRYAVAGCLGLSEVIGRLGRVVEEQGRIWKNLERLWEEVRELRRDFKDMLREQRRLRTSFESFGRALGVTFEDYTCSLC